jgi:tetratricopeptide (TPR) repeat protein
LRGPPRLYQFANPQAIEDALRLFNRATELDPDFASAYGRAAVCYARAKGQGRILGTANAIAEVSRLARRAVELGKDDAIALAASGWALANVARDLEAGAALIDRALVLNSNLAEAWLRGGWAKIWLGEPEAALERFARAMRRSLLDPWVVTMRAGIVQAHFLLGHYDEAVSWAAIALRDDPDHQPSLRICAASNAMAGLPTERLVAHVIDAKYQWHLPLYRQAQMLATHGIALDRSTLAFWVGYAAQELKPLWHRLREMLLASAKLCVDETPAPVLDPGRGRTKTGYFWVLSRDDRPWAGPDPPGVVYAYAPGHGAVHGLRLLVAHVPAPAKKTPIRRK